MITIENLSVSFDKKEIFKNINMKVKIGEIIHIIGPNGSGKSTFFKCLLGAIPYTGLINKNSSEIAVVADYTRIPEDLRVLDIIAFLNKRHHLNAVESHTDLYHLCQLEKIQNIRISQLSTGEKRKLEIFVALICGKKIFILDEMTNGLDHNAKQDVLRFLIQFRLQYKEVIFFYTTHHLAETIELNDKGRYLFFNLEEKTFEEKKIMSIEQLQQAFFKYNSI